MIRVGMGYDVHKLEPGLPLILGGITVEHHSGLRAFRCRCSYSCANGRFIRCRWFR